MPCGCVNRIRFWPLRRDDHSGVLIGASGERRSDWPAHVLANDVSTGSDRLHACRHKWQLTTTVYLRVHFANDQHFSIFGCLSVFYVGITIRVVRSA